MSVGKQHSWRVLAVVHNSFHLSGKGNIMSGLTLATADAVLKEDYLPGVREELNNDTFLQFAQENTEDITGRRAVLALHLGRNSGTGSRLEGEGLPVAGSQVYFDEYIPLRYHYASIRVTGQTIKAMASDSTSFVRAVRSEMDGATNDLRRQYSRQIFGTSDGIIAQCGVTTASTTVHLNATPVQVQQLEAGMTVDIGTVASPFTVAQGLTVVDATPAAENTLGGTVVLSAAVTTSAADFIFESGNGGNGANQRELTGLQTIVNSNAVDGGITLFNVNAQTYPLWQSYVDDNGGTLRAVTEQQFSKAQQKVRIKGGAKIDVWVTTDGVHRAYGALLQGLKRFPGTVDLEGGYQAINSSADGTTQSPLIWDRDCPANTAFGIRKANFIQFRMSDWEWFDLDGSVLHWDPGYDAYKATLFQYSEMAVDKRNAFGRINDLTES